MEPKEIILALHERNRTINPQTALSQAKTEEAMKMDYSGRFVFEFFQNAVDRAKEHIWITYDDKENTVVFANDGKEFTIEQCPDNFSVIENVRLDDFHALCSIFTSSKKPGESIGNKGVGFKSCWQFAESCRIVTKKDNKVWGFRLYNPFHFGIVENDTSMDDNSKKNILNLKLTWSNPPSFYFPLPLEQNDCEKDFASYPNASTVITMEGIKEKDKTFIQTLINEFTQSELIFVDLIRSAQSVLTVEIKNGDRIPTQLSSNPDGWQRITCDNLPDWDSIQNELITKAKMYGYSIENPRVAIAIPPDPGMVHLFNIKEKQTRKRMFYCYLPTLVSCGFNILVHGDFILDSSRKSIAVGDTNNQYNSKLLDVAAELFIFVLRENPSLLKRADAPAFFYRGAIDISTEASNYFVEKMREKLWGEHGISKELLKDVLAGEYPLSSYSLMLDCLKEWWDVVEYNKRGEARKNVAEDNITSHIRKAGIKLIPVTWNDSEPNIVTKATALPHRKGNENEKGEAIFLKGKSPDSQTLFHSDILTEFKGLAITSWEELKNIPMNYLGMTDYSLSNVIRSIRIHLESNNIPQGFEEKLLKCIVELLLQGTTKHFNQDVKPHCRFLSSSDQAEIKLSNDLSFIPLPTIGGGYQRARDCYIKENVNLDDIVKGSGQYYPLDINMLSSIVSDLPDDINPKDVALFFGVWNCIPLSEDGKQLKIPEHIINVNTMSKVNCSGFYLKKVSRSGKKVWEKQAS
ncbi:MAG: hypothetical protein WC799_15250 [Desulfobacteraceae bacterium]|jgi:hypothetical protein